MHVHSKHHNERDCQPNHNESGHGKEEKEDLPGLLPTDLPLPSTEQSECTEDEAMLESMEDGEGLDHDETSSSTPNQNNSQNWTMTQTVTAERYSQDDR